MTQRERRPVGGRQAASGPRRTASGPDPPEALATELRRRLAASVAYNARRLWRLPGKSKDDIIILDLLCEALARLGRACRPMEGECAQKSLLKAPTLVRELVAGLLPIAQRGRVDPTAPGDNAQYGCEAPNAETMDQVHRDRESDMPPTGEVPGRVAPPKC